ncbi:MAG: VWA domain-containing protein [Sandaracinus sp.]
MIGERRPWALVVSLAAVLSLASGCGGSGASYARFRRAATEGQIVAAEEVRAADFIDVHAEEDAPRPPPGATTTLPILVDAHLGAGRVSTSGGRAIVQVSMRGGTSSVREATDVVVVLDLSGSMQEGDKIGAVRHALARFVEGLDPRDRIAIVTFADDAHLALPPTEVGAARPTILGAIDTLRAYGATNLGAGLSLGVQVVSEMHVQRSGPARVVLLSDGVATVGETRPEALRQLSASLRARAISLTTVGMGEQIDFSLLESLANDAGGAFHYVDRPAEVERVFGRELAALTGIAARDAHVIVTLPPGATLVRSYDERTHESGNVLDTALGDVAADEALVVVHEIDLAPGTEAVAIPVEVRLGALDRGSATVASTQLPLVRDAAPLCDPALDASVLRNVTLGRIAWSVREASHLVELGDTTRAGSFAWGALAEAHDAQARLVAMGELERARSLEEPLALLARTARLLPQPTLAPAPDASAGGWAVQTTSTSARFAGWR